MTNPLLGLIIDRVRAAGGWIGFDEFMALGLYEPGLGYYAGGRLDPFGSSGDFVTAPMAGPWLAWAINEWARPLAQFQPLQILEFGGGTGELAAKILKSNAQINYQMLELSGSLRAVQKAKTQGLGPIQWIDRLPENFSGLVLANEVLDALPVKRFEWAGEGRVLEWGLSQKDGNLFWASRPADAALNQIVCARAQAAQRRGLPWANGFRGEWSSLLAPWIRALSESMSQGAILLFDYGFAQSELDHPGRTNGSLCAHLRHQRLDDEEALIEQPGSRDLTAHVNFSELARAAEQAGLRVSGFLTQGRFLLNVGILDHAKNIFNNAASDLERAQLTQSLQTLLLESEMGEVFKVMLLTKNISPLTLGELIYAGFEEGDRTEQLFADDGL